MITDEQLVYELATNLYINKDRIMDIKLAAGQPEFPDPNRPWTVYRDEWNALPEEQKQGWCDAAREWITSWTQKHGQAKLDYIKEQGIPVYSIDR